MRPLLALLLLRLAAGSAPPDDNKIPSLCPGAPRPPRLPGPPRRPGPARPRRQGRQGRRARGARRERRGRAAGSAGAARGARAARRGGSRGCGGAGGGVRGAPALRLQRQTRGEPGAAAARRAAALRAGAAERAGPLRRGVGQVHLPRARRLLLRGARHRLPRQPALRPGQERRVGGLLLPVLRGVAQARLAVGRRHGEAGARGPGVGAGRGGRLRRHLRQRQDGQHLLRVPGVLRLARLPCLRLMSAGSAPAALTPRGGVSPRPPGRLAPHNAVNDEGCLGRARCWQGWGQASAPVGLPKTQGVR